MLVVCLCCGGVFDDCLPDILSDPLAAECEICKSDREWAYEPPDVQARDNDDDDPGED